MNNDNLVNGDDRQVWVEDLRTTYFGDSNLDGEFNSSDFVVVFNAGQYEDGVDGNSTWASGDWNGDGREDLVISHLDAPAALLSNQTETESHFLAIELRGTRLSREAAGAEVHVTVGGQTHVRQLTAGDGNQSANERKLIFGLGSATFVSRLEIRWPGGGRQAFADLPVDSAWLAVENAEELLPAGETDHPPVAASSPPAAE